MKMLREWFIEAPWGKIALLSWGNPQGEPMMLVHGREDSAATFIPLLKLMPDTYYYVAIDLPGNGKSDPFPPGILISRFHFILAVEYAIKHLEWKKFVYMAHSMGTEQGLFYNAIYPGRIKKLIHLDPTPAIKRMFTKSFPVLYQGYYETYYQNYNKYNNDDRVYTKEQALKAVMKARGLNKEEAELILSRNLRPIGDGKFKLSWNRMLKIAAPWNLTNDYYFELFAKNAPPTLVISATHILGFYLEELAKAHAFIDTLRDKIPNFFHVVVDGGHDLHFLTPELIVDDIKDFLKGKFYKLKMKAKL